ncbi:MAG: tRNA threonylcarbamoyladenosine dehydratase [Bacteroidales bacterium]
MSNRNFPEWMSRTIQLLGEEKCAILREAHVLVAGMGGVGSMVAECLVRAGVGRITIIDNDTVNPSNINRQVPALHSTIGQSKVQLMRDRLTDINPALIIETVETYLNEETLAQIPFSSFDFVVDAIDTLTPKILLIEIVYKSGIPLTSSMGSGGKKDPTRIGIADFKKSYNCKLAYLLRKKLRKRGVHGGFKVVFSTESVEKESLLLTENEPNKRSIPGTVSYIPAIFGCMLSSVVIEGLTGDREGPPVDKN